MNLKGNGQTIVLFYIQMLFEKCVNFFHCFSFDKEIVCYEFRQENRNE